MTPNTWRGAAGLALEQLRAHLSAARTQIADRDLALRPVQRWADWLLYSVRQGLIDVQALRSNLWEHLTHAEREEVDRATAALTEYKAHAVEAGAHILPGA